MGTGLVSFCDPKKAHYIVLLNSRFVQYIVYQNSVSPVPAGVVEITRRENFNLIEKAGREGFQLNKAFRQLTDILKNFLLQLAADFFREEGTKSSDFIETRNDLNRLNAAREKQTKLATAKKTKLSTEFNLFFEKIESGIPNNAVETIFEELSGAVRAASEVSDPDRAADILIRAERNANNALSILKRELKITKPRGIGLSKQMTRDWEAYLLEYDRLGKDVFEPTEKKISEIVGASAEQAKAYLWQRKRFEALLKEASETSVKLIKAEAGETRKSLDQTHSKVSGLLRKTLVEITDLINDTQAEIQRTNIDEIGPDAAEEVRAKIEKRINNAVETHKEILESVRAQLEDINLDKEDNGHLITQADMLAAQEDELLAMKEQADTDLELVQLGMAVDIINHEFTGNINSIRSSLRVLGEWASVG